MLSLESAIPISRPSVPKPLPPHVRRVVVKGRTYTYYQRHRGTSNAKSPIKLPGEPWSAEWLAAYSAAANVALPQTSPNAVTKLIDAYTASPEWKGLAEKTRADATRYLERIRYYWGNLQVAGLEPHHVLELRDRYAEVAVGG